MKKIVVLGASGMLGHKVFEVLNQSQWQDLESFKSAQPMILVNQDCNNSCRLYKINAK